MEESTFKFSSCSRSWEIRCPEINSFILSRIVSIFSDNKPPYWVKVWPSSLVLADWLYLQHEFIKNKDCLDLGCGLGVTAMVGQYLGGNVTGIDYNPQALKYAYNNALYNGVSPSKLVAMDWCKPAIHKYTASVIWGSDFIYEKFTVPSLIKFFDHVLTKNGIIWVSGPIRPAQVAMIKHLNDFGWKCQRLHTKKIKDLYSDNIMSISTWEIKR